MLEISLEIMLEINEFVRFILKILSGLLNWDMNLMMYGFEFIA